MLYDLQLKMWAMQGNLSSFNIPRKWTFEEGLTAFHAWHFPSPREASKPSKETVKARRPGTLSPARIRSTEYPIVDLTP